MTAGGGAQEQARAASARVERKRRELAAAEQQAAAWSAGAEGERLVAAELEQLRPYGWRVMHDVHWPGRPKANVDHVLVGPGGVVVVDAKNWSSSVTVSTDGLRAGGYRKTRECESVASQVAAVAALLEPRHRTTVRGVMCMVQQDLAPLPTSGITVLGRLQVTGFLRELPIRLSPSEVLAIAEYLQRMLSGPVSPSQWTTGHALAAAPPGPVEPRPRRQVQAQRTKPRATGVKVAGVVALALTAPVWMSVLLSLLR